MGVTRHGSFSVIDMNLFACVFFSRQGIVGCCQRSSASLLTSPIVKAATGTRGSREAREIQCYRNGGVYVCSPVFHVFLVFQQFRDIRV